MISSRAHEANLSIDGGGIKGVFPASFLATVEESISEPIADYFDLIVGTSTGGIIALGLGLGVSASEILSLYCDNADVVFPRVRSSWLSRVRSPKFDPSKLRWVLEKYFGDRKLGDSRKRLVIPSVNLETGDVHIYKTSHHPRFERDHRESVIDIALATAAAPSYFPSHTTPSGTVLADGGMWANNPTGLAAVEAIGNLGWSAKETLILSLGCTTAPLNLGRPKPTQMGLGYWATRALDLMFAAQSSASMGTAFTLLGHDNVYRVSPYVAPKRFSLDKTEDIDALRGLGNSEARNALPNLRLRFLTDHAEEFNPYHTG